MTKTEFGQGLALLHGAFGSKPPKESVTVWWELFQEWPAARWKAACLELARTFRPTTARPWPVPADFEDAAVQAAGIDLEAERAWERVLAAINDQMDVEGGGAAGYWPRGSKLQPLDWAAIGGKQGLWALYEANEATVPLRKRDFIETYKRLAKDVALGRLPEAELPHLPPKVRDRLLGLQAGGDQQALTAGSGDRDRQ